MTRVTSVVFALLMIVPSPGLAQEFGIKGGLSLANINVRERFELPAELQWCCSPWDGTRHDMAVGLFGAVNVRPAVAIHAEVLFTRRGFHIDASEDLPGARLRMSYVEVPVLLQYVGGLVRVYAGGSAGIVIGTSQWSTDVTRSGDFLSRESLADVDVSFVTGASIYRGRLSLDVRYLHGLRNVLRDVVPDVSLKHKSLMFLLGWRLAGSGCACEPPPKAWEPWRR